MKKGITFQVRSKLFFFSILFFCTHSLCYAANIKYGKLNHRNYSSVETLASFTDILPRSVAVSTDSRVFLCCPRCPRRQGLNTNTLVELKDGQAIPYPDEKANKIDSHNPTLCIFSAMAAVVDDNNHLWVLDNGRKNRTLIYGGAKLIGIDLKTNKIFKIILLKNYVLSPDIVLYDLTIDPMHGKHGTALITAAGSVAAGTIIVSDLETGHTMRRLHQHDTLYPNENFMPAISSEFLSELKTGGMKEEWLPGSFGLTINGDNNELYYSAVSSQDIYSVNLDKLCNPKVSEKEVENSIKHVDYKMALGTSIECDEKNRIYLSDIEHNTIWRRQPNGTMDIIARNEKLCFLDHLLIAKDGYLYITTNQYRESSNPQIDKAERTPHFAVLRVLMGEDIPTVSHHEF